METYLSEYFVSEQELSEVSSNVRQKIDELMSGENRLHCFMQLYEIAKSAVERLESTDKSGFIKQIGKDLEGIRSDLDAQLEKRSREVMKDFDKLQETVQNAEKELQVRGSCIESVLNGMGKIEEFQQQIQEIRVLMNNIEQEMVELKNIRQSEPFIEMCKYIKNES